MKVLLVKPPKLNQVWVGIPDIFNAKDIYLYPPLCLMTLSGYLKPNYPQHQIELLDTVADGLSYTAAGARIGEINPGIIGIRALTHNLVDVVETIREARKACPKAHITLGGPHLRVYPDQAIGLPEVDSVVLGDGEVTIGELANALEEGKDLETVAGIYFKKDGQVIKNEPREPIHDLNTLPFPDRKALIDKPYFTPAMRKTKCTTLISSRGCPNRCSYCSTHKLYRNRTALNIVDEVEDCVSNLGIEEILFLDDTFNIENEKVMDVCREILKRKLKLEWGFKGACKNVTPELLGLAREAGCTKIHYGVETWSNEGLKAINKSVTIDEIMQAFKWTRKAGIRSIAFMMMACPFEKTKQDVLKAKDFIRKLDPDYVVYSAFSPYPDVPVFKEGVELGLWREDCWDEFLRNPKPGYDLPTFWNQYFTADDLIELFKELNRGFYYNPRTVMRSISNLRSMAELQRLVRGGLTLLKMEMMNRGRI